MKESVIKTGSKSFIIKISHSLVLKKNFDWLVQTSNVQTLYILILIHRTDEGMFIIIGNVHDL